MSKKSTFDADAISDQKRFVRGEHWIMARRLLRAREGAHHGQWRCLIVAGPDPAEEIRCIRNLMRRAHIVAADIAEQNVTAAIDAGADDVALCDLSNYRRGEFAGRPYKLPPSEVGYAPFDVICLDMTCSPSDWLAELVKIYSRSASKGGPLTKGGVFIVNFSYGRDVVERHLDRWERRSSGTYVDRRLASSNIPDRITIRLSAVLQSRATRLRSVLQYRGNAMPMLSCLLDNRHAVSRPAITYEKIDDGDYVAAVTADDIGDIYACPPERIAALRRKEAARKAVQTRTSNRSSPSFDLFAQPSALDSAPPCK